MIQCIKNGDLVNGAAQTFVLNLLDAYEDKDKIIYKPIITFTNQQTNKFVNLVPYEYTYDNKDRYVEFKIILDYSTQLPSFGRIELGTDDMPFGFYDVTIRENTTDFLPSDSSVLDRPIVYTGLMNLTSVETGFYANPSVTYNEYNTNDTDTDSVYITN
tara:strand:+ start:415 stop:891 length:477 start_codon:yes stop_codon:yes gene_type:complete